MPAETKRIYTVEEVARERLMSADEIRRNRAISLFLDSCIRRGYRLMEEEADQKQHKEEEAS